MIAGVDSFRTVQKYNLFSVESLRVRDQGSAIIEFDFTYRKNEESRKIINIYEICSKGTIGKLISRQKVQSILPMKYTEVFICYTKLVGVDYFTELLIIDTIKKTIHFINDKSIDIIHENSIAYLASARDYIYDRDMGFNKNYVWESTSAKKIAITYYINHKYSKMFGLYEMEEIQFVDNYYYSLLYDDEYYDQSISKPVIIRLPDDIEFETVVQVNYEFCDLGGIQLNQHLYIIGKLCKNSCDVREELSYKNSLPYVNSRQISFDTVELELRYPYSVYRVITKNAKFGFMWVAKQCWRAFKFAEIGAQDIAFSFK